MVLESALGRRTHSFSSITEGVFSDVIASSDLEKSGISQKAHEQYHADFGAVIEKGVEFNHPHSVLLQPVFLELNDPTADLVGLLHNSVPWDRYLTNLLPEGVDGIVCVLINTCGQAYTYVLSGNAVCHGLCPNEVPPTMTHKLPFSLLGQIHGRR